MIFAFDGYELDTGLMELRKGAAPVKMEPKAFRLLCLLVEERERALSRDEVLEQVWDGRIVSEASISSAVKSARRAIDDDGDSQRRIKTLRGYGFRFVGEVSCVAPATVAKSSEAAPEEEAQTPIKQPSIIALPFDVIGARDDHPAISIAIVHDVIQGLSRLRWLRVIARATAFQFGGRPLSDVAERLDVNYCLTGTIEVIDKVLVITVELVDLQRDSVVWVDRFEGQLDDVHELRKRIVYGTVASIETRISQHEARFANATPTESLDAWSAFHVGLVNMYRFTPEGNQRALALFDRAITLDPSFAKAHAGLSFVHFQNAFNAYQGIDKTAEAKLARQTADRSLELDELDHFGNFVRGRASWLTGDLEEGLDRVLRSTQINPNFAQGHYTAGVLGVLSGSDVDFEAAADRSTLLSPLDPMIYGFRGVRALGYLTEQRYAEAAHWANRSAHAPGASPIMDLVAIIANDLAGETSVAQEWADRAKARQSGINGDNFFKALQFRDVAFRAKAIDALRTYGI